MKFIEILTENRPRSPGRKDGPFWELDIDNKVYIVYDGSGKEVNRHTFQHVWDSSPARNAAQAEVNKIRADEYKIKAAADAAAAEAKPLSKYEQEYMDLMSKWNRYYLSMFSKDPTKRLPNLDDETKQVYTDQMDKWMKRLEQLDRVVRRSVKLGTYKPPQ